MCFKSRTQKGMSPARSSLALAPFRKEWSGARRTPPAFASPLRGVSMSLPIGRRCLVERLRGKCRPRPRGSRREGPRVGWRLSEARRASRALGCATSGPLNVHTTCPHVCCESPRLGCCFGFGGRSHQHICTQPIGGPRVQAGRLVSHGHS